MLMVLLLRKLTLADNDTFTNNTNLSQNVLVDENGKVPDIVHALAETIRKRIDTFNPQRRALLAEIKANIAYLVGEQHVELIGNSLVPIPKERIFDAVVNVLLPAVQKDMSVATGRPPIFDIVPGGTDDDDKATALVARKGYRHMQRINGKDLGRGKAVLWYDLSGIGWRKVFWNPNAKVIGINPPPFQEDGVTPSPGHIPDLPVGEAIMQGEVEIISVPTSQLIYDFRAGDLTKLSWIIHAKRVTSSWVLSTFGKDIHDKLSSQFQADGSSTEQQFETNILQRFTISFGSDAQRMVTQKQFDSSNIQLDSDKCIDYYEYWAKPTRENPTGNYTIMLGTQIVTHQPFPVGQYPHGELPFTPAAPLAIEGATSGGIVRISQARPLQRKLNRYCAQIDENVDVMGNAIIFSPRSAKLRWKTLDNHAGNIIEYDGPVGKPHREAGVPVSSQAYQQIYFYKTAIDDIFAFHGALKGAPPKNISSGKGIDSLVRADIEHLGLIVDGFEQADETVLYQALTLMAVNYERGRMINVVGSDYEWTLYEWDPEQLKGKFNVIIRHRSSMPKDKDLEAEQSFNLWSSGLLGDPQDPELRIWTMNQMHLGNIENILQKHSKQRNFAMKEFAIAFDNLKAVQVPDNPSKEEVALAIQQFTYVPSINPFDDHMVHIMCHKEYLLDKFWDFKKTGDILHFELLNNMGNHLSEHITLLAEQQKVQHDRQLLDQMLLKKATPEQIMLSKGQPNNTSNQKGK